METDVIRKIRLLQGLANELGMKISWVHMPEMTDDIEMDYGVIFFKDEQTNPAYGILAKDIKEKFINN